MHGNINTAHDVMLSLRMYNLYEYKYNNSLQVFNAVNEMLV